MTSQRIEKKIRDCEIFFIPIKVQSEIEVRT